MKVERIGGWFENCDLRCEQGESSLEIGVTECFGGGTRSYQIV